MSLIWVPSACCHRPPALRQPASNPEFKYSTLVLATRCQRPGTTPFGLNDPSAPGYEGHVLAEAGIRTAPSIKGTAMALTKNRTMRLRNIPPDCS